jgi:hypothetical protein
MSGLCHRRRRGVVMFAARSGGIRTRGRPNAGRLQTEDPAYSTIRRMRPVQIGGLDSLDCKTWVIPA